MPAIRLLFPAWSLAVFAMVLTTMWGNLCQSAEPTEWSRFRGPNGTGVSGLKGVPTTWTQDDYEWVVKLPGVGHSSPVLWGEKLFLTSGTEAGERLTLCLNAISGEEIWRYSATLAVNHLHKKNSYGSGTPCVDADRVYVPWGDEEHFVITAFTHGGELLWTRDLGPYSKEHGHGNSPIVHNGMVIVSYDQTQNETARVANQTVALDAASGEVKWSTEQGPHKASYATPMILDVPGKGTQIVNVTGGSGFFGLDPETGRQLWASGKLPERSVASPIYANGLLIGSCGSGGIGRLMVAVDPTGSGDVSASHVKVQRTKSLPYVPTPLVKDNYLYLWNDNGIVQCVDLNGDMTGFVWQERIGENYSSSPIMIDGKIYCISEVGNVFVLDASPDYKLYAKDGSPLGDNSYSTPAVGNGRLYLRGFSTLASLKARE